MDSYRGLDVCHIIFESCGNNLIMFEPLIGEPLPCVLSQAMERQTFNLACQIILIGNHHPALDRGNIFCDIKTETSEVAQGPDGFPFLNRLNAMRGIFTHTEMR